MGIFATLFLIIFSIAAILIILVVLLQDEQGEGFGGLFAGGNSSMPFGSTGGNILVRITSFLGVVFLISSVAVALAFKTGDSERGNVIGESRQLEGEDTNWFQEKPEEIEESQEVEAEPVG